MYIDKQTTVKFLINCGIRNVFSGECPVSNHVIIMSAKQIMTEYAQEHSIAMKSDMMGYVKPEYAQNFHDLMHARYNFFKHAKHDYDREIDIVNIQISNEGDLHLAVSHYLELFKDISNHMFKFILYITIRYPEWIDIDRFPLSEESKEIVLDLSREYKGYTWKFVCGLLHQLSFQDARVMSEYEEVKGMGFADAEVAERRDILERPFLTRKVKR